MRYTLLLGLYAALTVILTGVTGQTSTEEISVSDAFTSPENTSASTAPTNVGIQSAPPTTNVSMTITESPATPDPTTSTDTAINTVPAKSPAEPTSAGNSTESSQPTESVAPNTPMHSFDAGSFIGGIVLCGAVVAVTFFGCKVFRSKKPDYSTL